MLHCIKGERYTVIKDSLKNFNPGDIVIALEDAICPYCCLESNYIPGSSPWSHEYCCDEVQPMLEEELEGPKEEYDEIPENELEASDIVD